MRYVIIIILSIFVFHADTVKVDTVNPIVIEQKALNEKLDESDLKLDSLIILMDSLKQAKKK